MRDEQEREREVLENAMAALAKAQVLLEGQLRLRVHQAAARWPVGLLTVAVRQVDEIAETVRRAQELLGWYWRLRSAQGWECSSKERE